MDDSLERFFAIEFDDEIAVVVRRVADWKAGQRRAFQPLDKSFIVQFIYNHMRRSPEIYRHLDLEKRLMEITAAGLDLFPVGAEDAPLTPEEVFPPELRDVYTSNARVEAMARQSEPVLGALWRLKVNFAFPASRKKSFIVGSNPVIRFTNDRNFDLRTGDVELWASVAPDILMGLVAKGVDGGVVPLNDALVRHLNLAIYNRSDAVASPSPELITSIIDAR